MALLSVATFKVHFTSLSRYWSSCTGIVKQPSPSPPLSSAALYAVWLPGPLLCVCLCASLIKCVLCLCVCVCVHTRMYESRGDRCACVLRHEYMCVYTFILSTYSCLYTVCAPCRAAADAPAFSSLFVSTYIRAKVRHSLGESEAERTHFQPTVLPRSLSAEQ